MPEPGLGPDSDGVYHPGSPQHHWIEVSNPEDPDSPGKFTSTATVTLKWLRPLSGGRHVDDTYLTRPVGGIAIEKYQIRHGSNTLRLHGGAGRTLRASATRTPTRTRAASSRPASTLPTAG